MFVFFIDSFFGFSRQTFWDVIKAFLSSKRDPQLLAAFSAGKELVESISDLSGAFAKLRSWIRVALKERYLGDFIMSVTQDTSFTKYVDFAKWRLMISVFVTIVVFLLFPRHWYRDFSIFASPSHIETLISALMPLKYRTFNLLLNDLRLQSDDVWIW